MADDTKKQIILSVGANTQQAGAEIDGLKTKMNGLNETQLDKPFRGFKTEIKEATLEAQRLEAQYGKTSQQFINAAQKVAELKDRFGEFQNSISNFSPDNKLQPLVSIGGAAIKTVQGVTAGINLLGLQSGTAEAAIQKLTAIMAFSDVLNSIDDIKNGFSDMLNVAKNAFKSMSKGDLIGIAIIGITALGAAIYEAFINTKELTEEQKRYNEVTKIAIEKNGSQIATLDILIDRIKKGGLTQTEKTRTLKEYNEKLGDTLGKYDTYQKLENAMIANGPKYISYLLTKAKAEAAYGLLLQEQQKLLKAETTKAEDFKTFSILGIFFDDETTYQNDKKKATDRIQDGVNTIQNLYTQLQSEADKAKSDLNIVIPETQKTTTTVKKDVVEKYETTKTISDLTNPVAGETEQDRLNRILEFRRTFNTEVAQLDNERFLNSENLLKAGFVVEENTTNAKIALAQKEFESKKKLAGEVGNTLTALAGIVGQQTVAGKAMAVAGATINTWMAASEALKANYGPFGPAAQVARIVTVASVIATGLKQVKEIVSIKIPYATGGAIGSVPSAPSLTTAPVINASAAQQQSIQDVRVTNQNQAPIRAYITNGDLQSNEQKNRFLNSISTF